MVISIPPPLSRINDKLFDEKGVSVSILRLDLIHPYISGNKWFKLKYNIQEFLRLGKEYMVTFGGAYSNHIIATAAAGKEFGIKTIGIIRGEELNENSNNALRFAAKCGMKLFFVTRTEYLKMRESGRIIDRVVSGIRARESGLFVLPEGGSNPLAIKGCAEIVNLIPGDFDYICCACGTGSTLAGISTSINENQKAIGISVLRGAEFLEKDILNFNGEKTNFHLFHEYSFGGYAQSGKMLNSFCETFMIKHKIKIEPVYTGKVFYGLYDLIDSGFFPGNAKISVIHSGGVVEWDQSFNPE